MKTIVLQDGVIIIKLKVSDMKEHGSVDHRKIFVSRIGQTTLFTKGSTIEGKSMD